jgi:AcrR family transcriptional regulator
MAVAAGQPKAQLDGREALLRAALAAFYEQGFHGTTMRDIAARAGTAISHSYYYFPSKADLLCAIMVRVTEDLLDLLAAAQADTSNDPAARLAALVRTHVSFHTDRQAEAFVGNTELRGLRPADRSEVVALRDRVSSVFKEAVAEGMQNGVFHCPYPNETVLAIVTMCTAVANWYDSDGTLAPAAVADRYAALALRMAGYVGPSRGRVER